MGHFLTDIMKVFRGDIRIELMITSNKRNNFGPYSLPLTIDNPQDQIPWNTWHTHII